MVRELLDDHRRGETVRAAIGALILPGELPRVVACGDPGAVRQMEVRGDFPALSVNEVSSWYSLVDYDSWTGTMHLLRRSVAVLTGREVARLHADGELPCRGGVIRLFEEAPPGEDAGR